MPRRKQQQQQEDDAVPPHRSPVETEEELDVEDVAVAGTSAGATLAQQKKGYRPSKKEIPDYTFSDEQVLEIAEFVKDHPALYDKRSRYWAMPRFKEELWKELAEKFPGCTYLQVRKFYENKRTDYGKIEKRESRSGAPARDRTYREEQIMSTWSFLVGQIAHETTQASDRFSPLTKELPAKDDESSSDVSGLSAASIARRRNLRQ